MTGTILRLSHISKEYKMDGITFKALDDISLTVQKGEFIAIMGPSGSGKSTLMHIIGCLDRPSEGIMEINNQNIGAINDIDLAAIRNKYIGFVFQQFNLLRKTSALSNVELPLIYARMQTTERKERAYAILNKLGLNDKIDNYPSQLSGGQQQKVAIARALVTNPDILLADEPTGNLDSKSGTDIMTIFEDLFKEGKTIIIVTHDEHVANHARRIIRIADGAIRSDTKHI